MYMYDKKMAAFYILDILREHSDKNHTLTQSEINEKLQIIYDLDLDRKTIASHIQSLLDYGIDIVQVPRQGYYIDKRYLNEHEIKFLIDAVYSSKMISADDAKELSKKIYSCLSRHEQKDFSYIHKSMDVNRTSNEDIFKKIEIINQAIQEKKKISFIYQDYDRKGQLKDANGGKRRYVSPYFLINNFSKYYLICNFDYYNNHTNYRLEYMKDIEIIKYDAKPIEDVTSLGPNFNMSQHMNDHIYMFGGKNIFARVEVLDDKAITYVKDWFGSNATIMEIDGKIYASIKSNEKALVYWLLQYIEHIKVVEPQSLIDKMKHLLTTGLERYNN